MPTVEDVFVTCLPPSVTQAVSSAHVVQAAKVWLTRHAVLGTSAIAVEDFFAQPDTFGWAASPEFLAYWYANVSSKFLKFAASEYAYFHLPPEQETMWLTAKTAQLVKTEHLKTTMQQQLQEAAQLDARLPLRWGSEIDTTAILHALLFVLLYYTRPAIAVGVLEPVFLSILREQEEIFTIVPQLTSYFIPHMSFQSISFPDRIALLGDQLAQRGFHFAAGFTFISPNTTPRVVEAAPMKVNEVLRRVREVASTTDVRIHSRVEHDNGDITEAEDLSVNKYLSSIVHVCRQYYLRCRQASRKQQKNGETLLKLMPNDVDRVMKELHKIVRFAAPYAERFRSKGMWRDILNSEGWVPLEVVDEQLSLIPNSILKDLPSKERREIVESLLRQHDNFQRYQVDYCTVRNSAFHGQRCARSVYGHALENPPLYRYIICQPDCLLRPGDANAMASLPLYGWVALSEKPQKALKGHLSVMPLFDNIPFCVVMPAAAIGAFRDYDETMPTTKKYDEKLRRPNVYFAEVYLRALARDGAAAVVDGDALESLSEASTASSAVSSSQQRQAVGSEVSSVVSTSRASNLVAGAAPGTMTEVYNRVVGEADSKTQRWYVFPQYYVKRVRKASHAATAGAAAAAATTAAPPAQDAEGAPQPLLTNAAEKDTGDEAADISEASLQLAAVHRRPTRSAFQVGVPKLFFTGRVAELRELRQTEVSRHVAVQNDDDGDTTRAGDRPTQAIREGNASGSAEKTNKREAARSGSEGDAAASSDDDDDSDDTTARTTGTRRKRKKLSEARDGDQLVRYRGTAREFDAPKAEGNGSSSSGGEGEEERDDALLPPPTRFCEYVIATSRAPASLLPPVIVRTTTTRADTRNSKTNTVSSAQEDSGEDTSEASPHTNRVKLSALEPAAALYRRCFPPSRVQDIFCDYVDDALMQREAVAAKADTQAEALAAAEWQRTISGAQQWHRRLGQWGITPSAVPPARAGPSALHGGAPVPPTPQPANGNGDGFDVTPYREALAKFVASDQVACVLEIRVMTEAGLAIPGCRQGIEELKLFAKERALTYAKAGKAVSRDREQQQQQQQQRDGLKEGNLQTSSPTTLSLSTARNAKPISPEPGSPAGYKVYDLELMEFRKRVNWSVRDLDHTLSELQLTVRDVPYTTLTTALTRECEDRSENYELLEFIGDAVMDFLVIADACLLSNASYQRQCPPEQEASARVKWTVEVARVALPSHAWVHLDQPLSATMTDTVTALLCRNHVIAELLPPTVARHFSEAQYPSLAFKVRADVFEALIGAAYRSGVGLDRLRLLLRRLFSFLPAAVRTAITAKADCHAELLQALQSCPYLTELEEEELCVETILRYRTTELFERTPALRERDDAAARAMEKEAGVNTHLASSRLPRIQAKDFATMFTTGSAYAYRRLFAFDTVRVHNRILHLFSERSIGFVNEIFTDTIHLVLDIDKVAIQSWGLLQILWGWYKERYGCPAGVLALDCSGQTMSSEGPKWKDSCHFHFPQITVGVDTWDRLVTDIRATVVAALSDKEARLRETFAAHAHDYRVWLRRRTLLKAVKSGGGEARPHLWSYCDADTLLQLAGTSRAVRQSVLEHVAYVTRTVDGTAAFAGLASAADIFVGDATAEEEMVVVEHVPTRRRLLLPLHWVALCRADPPQPVFKPTEMWGTVIDQELTKSRKLRLYLNDKCDTIYGVERRPLVLDTLLVSPPLFDVRRGRVSEAAAPRLNGECVLYRPQRFDRPPQDTSDSFCLHRTRQDVARRESQHAMRRHRDENKLPSKSSAPLHLSTGTEAKAEAQLIEPLVWDVNEFGDDLDEGWVVECAHRSTLTLSSLRTSEYRGTDGRTYASWVDCPPPPQAAQEENKTPASVEMQTQNSSTLPQPPPVPLLSQEGECDLLPSFDDVFEHRITLPGQLGDFEWMTWLNFFKMRSRDYVMREDRTFTIRVWSPAWWAFDAPQQTATFYIATEAVLHVRGANSLAQALAPPTTSPPGGAGLERVAQLFMPQLSTRDKTPIKVKESRVYIVFAEKSSSTAAAPPPAPLPLVSPATAKPRTAQQPSIAAAAEAASPNGVTAALRDVFSAASPVRQMPLIAPRVTFGAVPHVVSLAKWVEAAAATPAAEASAAVWLRRAVSFVFSATAARTDFGSLPVVLCDTEVIYRDVWAMMQVSYGSTPWPQTWCPFALPLYDAERLQSGAKDLLRRQRYQLRHIFVMTSAVRESKTGASAVSKSPLSTRIQAFHRVVSEGLKESFDEQRFYYVSTDALRNEIQTALSPAARVM